MRLPVRYRLLERLDRGPLDDLASSLAPLFAKDASTWERVLERSRFIDVPAAERPGDVAYRKMRPRGYLQLSVVNDEVPCSPWALDLPPELATSAAMSALVDRVRALCVRHFGPGELPLLVFAVLAPRGKVPTHRDMGHNRPVKALSHHVHVAITDAPDVEYKIDNQRFPMEPGGVYEIDNLLRHSVVNRGDSYRINLMLDWAPAENAPRVREALAVAPAE